MRALQMIDDSDLKSGQSFSFCKGCQGAD